MKEDMIQSGHAARKKKLRNSCSSSVGKPEKKRSQKHLSIVGK
jgi:hypothetical protein